MAVQLVFLISSYFISVSGTSFFCDRERFPLVTDFGQENCDNENFYFYREDAIHGCFPGCVKANRDGQCSGDFLCPPGYKCQSNENNEDECVINEDSCFKYHVEIINGTNRWTQAMWKPECLPDETWAPKQCKGELANGRCFCFDARGNRIFGDAFRSQDEDMTCACSRRRAELEHELKEANAGDRTFISMHCDSMGNYEPLQCDVNSQQCWCVEPKTGNINGSVVPESLMKRLHCYNTTKVGSQYLRQCESHLYAKRRITDEFYVHGTSTVNFQILLCQYDGSYGPFRILEGIASCVWRDNSLLGQWLSVAGSGLNKINCNCARDTRIFSLAGLRHTLICASNGNYEPLQHNGRHYFCVDEDGFMNSPPLNERPNCSNFI